MVYNIMLDFIVYFNWKDVTIWRCPKPPSNGSNIYIKLLKIDGIPIKIFFKKNILINAA